MARESQGLQVLLIVFVMLFVIAGVSCYLYIKKVDELTKTVAVANAATKQAEKATDDMQKERNTLKKLIGLPERTTDEIVEQYAKDIATYKGETKLVDGKSGNEALFPPGTLYYQRLVASMYQVIQDRTNELLVARGQVADLETQFKNLDAKKNAAIASFTADKDNLRANVQQTVVALQSAEKATALASSQLVQQMTKIKKDATAQESAAMALRDAAIKEAQKAKREADEAMASLGKSNQPLGGAEAFAGEINFVSLPSKMVWINRGKADGLQLQTKFTVYSAESTVAAKAVKKGAVEVTAINGAHLAQCRILEDKLADPIMAGDKVFSLLWSPGQQNHFALTGIMNLDGDGRNQFGVVRGLINESGGVVDCWLDEEGHKHGQITVATRYLVLGEPADNKSPEFIKNNGEIISDADHYHLQKLNLIDFKQQVNYQKTSSVEHFGSGASSSSGVGRAGMTAPAPAPAPKPPAASAPKPPATSAPKPSAASAPGAPDATP